MELRVADSYERMPGSLVLCPCPVTGLLPILITSLVTVTYLRERERAINTNCLVRVVIVYLTQQKYQKLF